MLTANVDYAENKYKKTGVKLWQKIDLPKVMR